MYEYNVDFSNKHFVEVIVFHRAFLHILNIKNTNSKVMLLMTERDITFSNRPLREL